MGSIVNFTLCGFQRGDGGVKILDFEARRMQPSGRGFQSVAVTADGKRAGADFVFDPLHAAGFADAIVGFKPEHAFVKLRAPVPCP